MALNYGNLTRAGVGGKKGGYKDLLYYIPTADATFAKTVAAEKLAILPVPGVPVLGDYDLITTAHTIVAPKGWYTIETQRFTPKLTSSQVGEPGAEEDLWQLVVNVLGDDHVISELVRNIRNTDTAILVKDADCQTNDVYIQLGDNCSSVKLVSVVDSGGADEQGSQKKWTLTFTCKSRYFYKAAVLLHA